MKAKKALEETAKAYHVSVSEVYREIDFCISEAMKNPEIVSIVFRKIRT